MTQTQFEKKCASTINSWVAKMVKRFRDAVKKLGEKEARLRWRETYGLSFVEQYTVQARFRHYKKFPWEELPESAKKTLNAQVVAKKTPKTKKAKTVKAQSGNYHLH